LSNKSIAISAVIVVSIITFVSLLVEACLAFQGINPVAVIAAIAVAVLGIAWFKKTVKY
jgi:hypothetical protein